MAADPGARLLRQTSVYLGGQALRVLTAAAQLPLFAVYVTPFELGRFVTAQAVLALARIASQLGFVGAMFRLLAEQHAHGEREAARSSVTTAAAVITLLTLTMAAGVAVGARVLHMWGLAGSWVPIADAVAVILIVSVPRDLADVVLRATNRAGRAAMVNSAVSVGLVVAWAAVLVGWSGGALQMLWGTAAVLGVTSLVLSPVLAPYVAKEALSRAVFRRLARFALPATPAVVIDWVQQFADRFFMGAFVGLEGLGVYGLAQRVATSLRDIAFTGITSAWDPFTYTEHRRPNAAALYGRVTLYFAVLGMVAVVATSAAVGPLLEVMGADSYSGAGPLVFFLATAYWLSLLRHMFLAPTAVRERTDRALPVWALSGISAIALSLALIPFYEEDGAAWAKVGTYAIGALIAIPIARSLWRIEYDWRAFGALVVAGVLAHFVAVSIPLEEAWAALFVRPLVALGVLLGLLLAARTIGVDEARWLRGQAMAMVRRA